MQRNLEWARRALPLGTALLVTALVPAALHAQNTATVTVSATVLPAQGTRSWQAVMDRVHGVAAGPAGAPAKDGVATIAERTERTESVERRIISVEYLRS